MGRPPKVKPEEMQPPEKLVMIPETAGMGIGSDRDVPPNENLVKPLMTDPKWSDYFISFLQPNERVKNESREAPTCDGLRRVFELLVGEIISSVGTVRDCPNNANMQRAVVEYRLQYKPHGCDYTKTVGDGADISPFNAKAPYKDYPVATAMTTAESRCLKKAAKLVKVLTADELIEADESIRSISTDIAISASNANVTQVTVIKNLVNKAGIDMNKMFKYFEQKQLVRNTTLDTLLFTEAQSIVTQLSKYMNGPDNGGEITPTEILKS